MLKVHQPLLLGTIGAILGLAIVLPGIEIEQAMRPFFLIWLFLVCLQTGFWTIVESHKRVVDTFSGTISSVRITGRCNNLN